LGLRSCPHHHYPTFMRWDVHPGNVTRPLKPLIAGWHSPTNFTFPRVRVHVGPGTTAIAILDT